MRTLVWFRSDLRTLDNTALHHACKVSAAESGGDAGVVAVYLISPGEWGAHDYAPVKVDLILRTLPLLSQALEKLHVPLLIRTVSTPSEVPGCLLMLAREHRCGTLFFNKEYEFNEVARDAAVCSAMERAGIKVHACTDQSLIEPGEVRTGEGRAYTVFTPFKKNCYRMLSERGVQAWPAPKKQPGLPCRPDLVPGHVAGWRSTVPAALWPSGERHAARSLDAFIESRARTYTVDRDLPGTDGTSRLSPYLTIGSVSPRQCVAAAIKANSTSGNGFESGEEGLTNWITELLWREFYIHIVHAFPRVCKHRAFQPATEAIRWSDNEEHFDAWKVGRTGVPIVDAGMRQLRAEGWMHNRVRMIAAMYLTKNLFIDWRRGERWFMQNLVDGFLASNNGGWQWCASTGTDAAPYFRVFNPVSQSERFDPDGSYIRRYVPELRDITGEAIHDPSRLPPLARARIEYPPMLVELAESRRNAIEAFAALRG